MNVRIKNVRNPFYSPTDQIQRETQSCGVNYIVIVFRQIKPINVLDIN